MVAPAAKPSQPPAPRPVDKRCRAAGGVTHNVAMSATLGDLDQTVARSAPSAPPATRARQPGWRDPRMWVGIAIVALSVVAGARVVGAADETVPVWSLRADLAAGQPVAADDLVATRVRFADPGELGRYLPADRPLPAGATLARAVGEGELLPRDALGEAGRSGVSTLPLVLPALAVPPDLVPGSRVDVWAVTEQPSGGFRAATVLEDVEVVAVPAAADGFAAGVERQLLLGIGAGQEEAVAATLEAAASGTLTVQRRG